MTVECEICGRKVKCYKGTDLPRAHKRAGGGRCPGGGRFGGEVSPARKEAARENGSSEAGGRPRKHRYFELFEDIEEPPDDPLKLCEWAQRINALALRETVAGRGCNDLNAEIRASSKVIATLVPRTILSRASDLVKGEEARGRGKAGKNRHRTGTAATPAPSGSRPIRGR